MGNEENVKNRIRILGEEKIMNILITGGTGFVGAYMVRYLAELGNNIIATYRTRKPVRAISGVKYIKQELSETIKVDEKIDVIIHTACSSSGEKLSTGEYIRDNVTSALNIAEFAKKKNVRTLVYFSTRSVYGEVRENIVDEDGDIINPDMYGITKYVAENIFRELKQINTIGLRTPGIIGPGAHDIWLVNITKKILSGENVNISDFMTQNLVWIDDIATFINKLIIKSDNDEKFKYDVVNLACDKEINNIEIAQTIKERLNSKSHIIVEKSEKGLFRLNSQRACEMGYSPISPKEIVNKYLDCIIKEAIS